MPIPNLRPEDVLHKSQLNRTLIEIADSKILSQQLAFKGGTCAAMLGYLDRFSIDLDFDQLPGADEAALRTAFLRVFKVLGLEVLVAFDNVLFFQLRYSNDPGKRNKLKVSANSIVVIANEYKVQYFSEIDRMLNSQTIETMFANKLVAVKDRYEQHHSIAARDIYDVHYFFLKGYDYKPEVIRERTGLDVGIYFFDLVDFLKTHVNQRLINEDLNSLLPYKKFQSIRKVLLPETIAFLENESQRSM
jgi:predicted nucleotidyltransferase component of viral defense system